MALKDCVRPISRVAHLVASEVQILTVPNANSVRTTEFLLASLVIFWYSRKREFAADEGAARLMGSPFSMVAALRRLENLQPGILPDSIKAFGITGKKSSIFSTHPSIDERVDALMNLQIVPGL